MISIDMPGLDFRQDTEPLIKSFFPGLLSEENISVCIDCHGSSFILTLKKDDTVIDTISEEVEYLPDSLTDKDKHRDYRNQLLRAIYRLLNKFTDISLPWGILTGVRPTKLVYERIERQEAGHLAFLGDKYLVSQKKAALATLVAAKEYQLLEELKYKEGYSLYVGTPFCPSICNYCSFGSHPLDRFECLVEPYIEALLKEISATCKLLPNKKLQTIYFGGGTPTSVSASQLRRVIRAVKESFDMSGVKEFTVEAGRPDSITEEKLNMLKEEGVTRISVNPQTMVERTLEVIGRRHTALQTIDAFHLARQCGFDNINMDIIAGLSGEQPSDFQYTLSEIEKLDPECLTVHTLAHKRAARLTTESELYAGLEARGVSQMVEMAASYAKEHGYEPYYMYRQKNMTENLENVGYAKRGKESLYNILIMEEKQMILALGAGASSKFVRDCDGRFERVENVKNVSEYISRIDEMIARKKEYIERHLIGT